MINVRYDIIEKVGEGGNGEVYLVHDTLTGCRVAMKLLSPSSSKHLNENAVRKEFSILSGLSHPNLIRVFDFGMVRRSDEQEFLNRHYFTMEYLEGDDVLQHVRCLPSGKDRVGLLEHIFIQSLGVLAHIHRAGIIHCDIKPQNLILIHDKTRTFPTLKLTDFGFSETTMASADIPVRGTLEYIAPEVVRGLPIDHRIDLYSLGATFYHLWEGRCPFEAALPVELLKMVVANDLPTLTRVAGVQSQLPELIERLCRKDPNERFTDACQVLMNFASSHHEDKAKEALYLGHQSPFVGRTKEKCVIEDILQKLEDGTTTMPKSVIVVGAEGIGKTEFLHEVATASRSRAIITLQSEKCASGKPFGSIERALRQLDIELCIRNAELPFRNAGNETAIGLYPSSEDEVEFKLKKQTRRYAACLRVASTHLPVLFILDDFASLDPYSQETIRLLGGDSHVGNMVVVASIRDDDVGDCLFGNELSTRIVLKELSEPETGSLIEAMLGRPFVSTGIVHNIHALYGGIPYVIMEAIKSIARALPLAILNSADRVVERADDLLEFLSLRFEEFFGERFHDLLREKQIILELISCFDVPPTYELLKRVVPFQRDRLADYLVSLEDQGYLLSSEQRYHFRHLKLKRDIYDSIIYDRVDLHAFIATTLETLSTAVEWADMGELGRQFKLGNGIAKAVHHFEAAGDLAKKQSSFAEAIEFYNDALGCLADDKQELQIALSLGLAEAHQAKGSDQEGITIYAEVLDRLTMDDARRPKIHKALGKGFARLGENAKALQHFQEAIRGTIENGDRLEIQQEIIALKIAEGIFDEAIQMSEAQKKLAAASGDRNFLALIQTDLGIAHFYKGNLQDSLNAFQSACIIYEETGNKTKTADAMNNIGNVLSAMKDFRGAAKRWRHALELVGDENINQQRGLILNNLGIAHYKLREFAEARSEYDRSRKIFGRLNSKSGLAMTLTNLGEVSYAEGKYEESLHQLTDALTLYQDMQDSNGIAQILLEATQLYLTIGNLVAAQESLHRAVAVIEKFNLSTFKALSFYLQGSIYLPVNKYDEAKEALRAAEMAFQVEGAFTGGYESELEKRQITLIRIAEVHLRSHTHEEAVTILQHVLSCKDETIHPLIFAEANFQLGEIAHHYPALLPTQALMYFRQGLSLIENEQVSEISWKLSCALGREFEQRGNREKAKQHIFNAKRIIEYFSSLFVSEELCAQYLASDDRREVLELIESQVEH